MTLSEKQRKFTLMTGKLIVWAFENGFELTYGEVKRTPAQAAQNELTGVGIRRSLHCDGLAVDFNLFIGGKYCKDTKSHLPLGEYWESLGGSWGGRFEDGNHYSLAHEGRR